MNRKKYFNERKNKYAYINYFQSCIIILSTKSTRISIHFRQRCTSFWNLSFVFCHSNLLAPFLHLSTALPNILLYIDHHKPACICLWISIRGTFSAVKNSVTACCLKRTSENSSTSMCTGWECKHLCVQGMMEETYHATTQNWFYPGTSNVNKNITVEAKLISPTT